MKQVLIVNGQPQSGKDTFAAILGNHFNVSTYSSVDKIKEMALKFGWDGLKDEKGRKLLSELKKALVEYDDLPTKYMEERYKDFIDDSDEEILVLFIRETEEIEKAKQRFFARTVFVNNPRASRVVSNDSDRNISSSGYDYVVPNDGTLQEYEETIEQFAKTLHQDYYNTMSL